MHFLRRTAPWFVLAAAGLPSVAFAQEAHDCAPGMIWEHGACIPDPMLAEPISATGGSSGPVAAPSLRIETLGEHDRFDVTVDLPGGTSQHCAADVTHGHPCVLDGLTAGQAHVTIRGTGTFGQDVELAPGRQRVTLTHTAAANGVLPGTLVVIASLLLGGGAVWMFAVCTDHNSCNDEVITGAAVPMAIASGAGLILGGGMLFWHRPEANAAQVVPDDESASVPVQGPSIAFGATPLAHGGAQLGFGVTF